MGIGGRSFFGADSPKKVQIGLVIQAYHILLGVGKVLAVGGLN